MWAKSYHIQSKCIRICYIPFYCSYRINLISFVCFTAVFNLLKYNEIKNFITYSANLWKLQCYIHYNHIIKLNNCRLVMHIFLKYFIIRNWICHAGNISSTGNFAHRLHWQKIPSYWSDRNHNFTGSIHERFGSDATIVNPNDSCNQRWAGNRWPFNICWINVTSLSLKETSITASRRGIYSTKANRGPDRHPASATSPKKFQSSFHEICYCIYTRRYHHRLASFRRWKNWANHPHRVVSRIPHLALILSRTWCLLNSISSSLSFGWGNLLQH